jgi:hypothetical protein
VVPSDLGLTPRQADVLYLILQGKPAKRISLELDLVRVDVIMAELTMSGAMNGTRRHRDTFPSLFATSLIDARGRMIVPFPPGIARTSVSAEIDACVAGASSDELEAVVEARFPGVERTRLGALTFLVQHDSYHLGQLALLRKPAGLPAMSYR